MKFRAGLSILLCTCVVSLGFAGTAAANGFQKAGAHGGSVSGSSASGSVSASPGTATVTNGSGAIKTVVKPTTPPSP